MRGSKSRRMAAEAAERARVEREGLVVLKLKMADLFANRDTIVTKMAGPTENIRGLFDFIVERNVTKHQFLLVFGQFLRCQWLWSHR